MGIVEATQISNIDTSPVRPTFDELARGVVDFGFLAVFAAIILLLIVALGFYAIKIWAKKQDAMLKAEEEKRKEDRELRERDYQRLVILETETKRRLERVESGIIPALERLAEDQEKAASEKKFWGEMTESLATQLLGVSSVLGDLATKQDIVAHNEILEEVRDILMSKNLQQDEIYKILQTIEIAINNVL